MNRCRSCGGAITWAKTDAGKSMPVDVEPTEDGTLWHPGPGRVLVVTANTPPSVKRYRSHFATCPHANQHRSPRS